MRPQTAFDETLGRLQGAIKLGLLAPGSKLPAERQLCAQLRISRSTLRQALLALTEAGYLRATRGRGGGTFVADRPPPLPVPSLEFLRSWREVCNERLSIELGVVALAATRASPQSLAPLRALVATLGATTDTKHYLRLDRQFHIALAVLADSSQLALAAMRVQSNICDLLGSIPMLPESRGSWDASHEALLAALAERDVNTAMSAMCKHLNDIHVLLDRELGSDPVSQATR